MTDTDEEELAAALSDHANPEDKESWSAFFDKLKHGHLMEAGMVAPGTDKAMAAITGALGPLTGPVAAAQATVSPLAGAKGDWLERYRAAQAQMRGALERHPVAGIAGGLAGGAAVPLPMLNGGASMLGKIAAGATNGAAYGGAQSFGLGEGVKSGALTGGAIGGIGGALGGLIDKAAKSEFLSPLVNRLKYLKPSPQEAQPLSEAGGDIRSAITDTSAQGLWKGIPGREAMLERLQGAQRPAGAQIGSILEHADRVNTGVSPGSMVSSASPAPKVMPDASFPHSQDTLKSLLRHAAASGDNPNRLMDIAQGEQANLAGAWGAKNSLADLNRAKQELYTHAYTPNTPDMAEKFLPGRDQLLRALGRDTKESVQGALENLSQIDPSVDARGFAAANKQYGTLADLIGPLNRAIGKDIAGENSSRLHFSPTSGHVAGSAWTDALNLGGRRYLLQAHAGEGAQAASKALQTYKPARSVAQAFIAGTTPALNDKENEDEAEMQP
jgi:hypothetical protein